MNRSNEKKEKRNRRHARIRSRISGTPEIPRLSVFKSNTTLYAQLIDDTQGVTLASATSKGSKAKGLSYAKDLGAEIAKKAEALKIKKIVFDRGGFIYTGKVKALAEGAREGGLSF